MSYGPYTTVIPAGSRTANFILQVDNNTANNNLLLTIDAFDGTTWQQLGSRDIGRMDFTAANAPVTFPVSFTNPGGHQLEFRIQFHGGSYILEHRIEVN